MNKITHFKIPTALDKEFLSAEALGRPPGNWANAAMIPRAIATGQWPGFELPPQPRNTYHYRVAGLEEGGSVNHVPLRAPHHSISPAGLFGSLRDGHVYRPGEIQLAQGGILFLDDAHLIDPIHLGRLISVLRAGEIELTDRGARIFMPVKCRLIAAYPRTLSRDMTQREAQGILNGFLRLLPGLTDTSRTPTFS